MSESGLRGLLHAHVCLVIKPTDKLKQARNRSQNSHQEAYSIRSLRCTWRNKLCFTSGSHDCKTQKSCFKVVYPEHRSGSGSMFLQPKIAQQTYYEFVKSPDAVLIMNEYLLSVCLPLCTPNKDKSKLIKLLDHSTGMLVRAYKTSKSYLE